MSDASPHLQTPVADPLAGATRLVGDGQALEAITLLTEANRARPHPVQGCVAEIQPKLSYDRR
jgi:hypothetical protein